MPRETIDLRQHIVKHKDETGKVVERDTSEADKIVGEIRKMRLTTTGVKRELSPLQGRNHACYCGSGKKLKSCCGKGL